MEIDFEGINKKYEHCIRKFFDLADDRIVIDKVRHGSTYDVKSGKFVEDESYVWTSIRQRYDGKYYRIFGITFHEEGYIDIASIHPYDLSEYYNAQYDPFVQKPEWKKPVWAIERFKQGRRWIKELFSSENINEVLDKLVEVNKEIRPFIDPT